MNLAADLSETPETSGTQPAPLHGTDRALVWFRRDLRSTDQAALYHALRDYQQVWCVFVFDTAILQPLLNAAHEEHPGEMPQDRRVEFILTALTELDQALRANGGGLLVRHGDPVTLIPALSAELDVAAVLSNRDYEPAAIARDAAVAAQLHTAGRQWRSFKDQVIFEHDEVLTGAGKPFSIFMPYRRSWMKHLTPAHLEPYPVESHWDSLAALPAALDQPWPTLAQLGFGPAPTQPVPGGMSGAQQLLDDFMTRIDLYAKQRDFPWVKGPSYLSVHLRFGTISIRTLARAAHADVLLPHGPGSSTWLSELIWRDFFFMILATHPRLADGESFNPKFASLGWETGPQAQAHWLAWRDGRTGYPLIDAAMQQLNQTGYMHNRLRMLAASFLVKDLGLDWRWGERYFATRLNDFDFAANNGGWQWAASTGCDAQPWFRMFNPVRQSETFDPHGRFIKRYLPQLAGIPPKWIHAPWLAPAEVLNEAGVVLGENYPRPVVDHAQARLLTLARFGV
ncbi:deoxyribodipyrimidine photo-lyase [Paraburkholderia bonniea]|uniref:cryptochrome/photolyase family protein n=1 Tax=Paraburkholderia bonniea TaxID=2152891 RepID=UPI001292922A|nr:deoxyribodipyrimidine photo-lyase [Paraburkholderia bonniea]WJF89379.1 deoxyribodipyrimidine photo-lyase [Paraburkholderia bonniea]WJF92694.1 deoxyribodipyrimidine photo-lyase [Paraburkholderia bonniea]